MGNRSVAVAAALALALSSAGCMGLVAAKREKRDVLNVVLGLPLDVALAYASMASISAINGDGFQPSGASVLIGSLVIMSLDALMLPTALRCID